MRDSVWELIIVLLFALVLGTLLLAARGHDPAQNTSEGRVLIYGTAVHVAGSISSLFFAVVGLFVTAKTLQEPSRFPGGTFYIELVISVFMYVLAIAIIAEQFFVRLVWNDQEIIRETPWRGRQVIRWSGLRSVSYVNSRGYGTLIFRNTASDIICVKDLRSGWDDLVRDVLRLAPPGAIDSDLRQSLVSMVSPANPKPTDR